MKKRIIAISLAALALLLGGCRVRTTLIEPAAPAESTAMQDSAEQIETPAAERQTEETAEEPPEEAAIDTDAPAERDEASEQRAYDADASGELTPEAEDAVYAAAQTPAGASIAGTDGAGEPVSVEAPDAALTATETVGADEAEQSGADEDGAAAESAAEYYLALLSDRVGDLFECKRLYVYWESEEDHRTVGRDSCEQRIIQNAGAYSVSVKLREEDLTVDDGWVKRKNPNAVVKVVTDDELARGGELCAALSARQDWDGTDAVKNGRILLLSGTLLETAEGRTAAAVYLAKLLYPEQMAGVDADEALRALLGETAGRRAYAAGEA